MVVKPKVPMDKAFQRLYLALQKLSKSIVVNHITHLIRREIMSSRNRIVLMTDEALALKNLRIKSDKSLRKIAELMNLSFVRAHQMGSGRENGTKEDVEKFLSVLELNWEDWENQLSVKANVRDLRQKCHDRLDEIEPSKLELIYSLLAQF